MSQDSTSTKPLGALDNYVLLGRSGLRVSPLCLGTLTFGEQWGYGANFEDSKEVFDYYFEHGGNFIDTANVYTGGESERFLGQYIADKRSQVVISTKYSLNITSNPNAGGNHRKSLVENLDESLKRLDTGYVDILYVHAWEYRTPVEEVMRSLDDAVRSGKVHYIAVSDTPAWVISRANTIAELRGWSRFIGLQTRYNLLDRSMEFDLQPACAEVDVGILPWGCIAEGFLTGKYTRNSVASIDNTKLGRQDWISESAIAEKNWKILDEVSSIAKDIERSPVQVALNWISQKPGIISPVIGARTKAQLVENIRSLEFKLSQEQMERLNAISAQNEIPYPQSKYSRIDAFICKSGIQIPEKYKPVINLVQQKMFNK